nr:MAG TPA: hypothetical protein [Caudoviricetes sp.]
MVSPETPTMRQSVVVALLSGMVWSRCLGCADGLRVIRCG